MNSTPIINRYAVSEETLKSISKMGYVVQDLRPSGISKVKICTKQGKKIKSAAFIDYSENDVILSNSWLMQLVVAANNTVPGSPYFA